MHLDPMMLPLVAATLVILVVGLLLRLLHQPHVVGYLAAGIVLGPFGLRLVTDEATASRLGAVGVVLLLFFIGMEVSPRKLVSKWKIAVLGTLTQIAASVAVIAMIGTWLDWPLARIVLLGFAISLSSTAVVLSYLRERGLLESPIGEGVLVVILAQDVALVPMLIVVGILGGGGVQGHTLLLQTIGSVLILALVVWLTLADRVRLPLGKQLRKDHELQIFAAFALCFGFALVTGLFELSTALGAFVAGMVVGAARETEWIHHRLESFRVVFVAIFFVSIGLLVDVEFVFEHFGKIVLLVGAVLVTNTLINGGIFRALGDSWGDSLYAGALLAQIGEFSFLLAAVGQQTRLITEFAYQMTVAAIALSLLLSPAWIAASRSLTSYFSRRSGRLGSTLG